VTGRLGDIAHVKVLRGTRRCRSSTRGRVTDDLVAALRSTRKTVYGALHANHARD